MLFFAVRGVHFSLHVVVYVSPWGACCPSVLKPTMIKLYVRVSATHLRVIIDTWRGNQCTELQPFLAEAISASCWCCSITTWAVVWTEKWLPSDLDWLQVESLHLYKSWITLIQPLNFCSSYLTKNTQKFKKSKKHFYSSFDSKMRTNKNILLFNNLFYDIILFFLNDRTFRFLYI